MVGTDWCVIDEFLVVFLFCHYESAFMYVVSYFFVFLFGDWFVEEMVGLIEDSNTSYAVITSCAVYAIIAV